MQSLSASPGRRPRTARAEALTQRVVLYLVAASASVAAAGSGALAAASSNLAIVGAAGLLGAACLAFASSAWSLTGVLIIRGLTDASAEVPIVAGLNAGSLVGLVLIMSAGGLIAARLAEGRVAVRGLALTFVIGGLVGYWFGIGVLRYGMDQTLTRELVRTTSIIAVGLIAANSDRSITASRMGTIIVLAALIPAAFVAWEALSNWSEMVGGGLRPRGTMSHPNAAAILFGIAAPMAAWKAIHDRAGVHYLWAAGLLVLAVLLTRSMGGLAQLIVAMLALGVLQNKGIVYRLGVFLVVATLVGLFVFDPLGISRVSELEATGYEQVAVTAQPNSFEWRLINWRLLIDRWQETKLLGHGLGTTDEIVTPLGHLPHSDPIRFLVETGVLGVALIAAAGLFVLTRLYRYAKAGPNASFSGATLAVLAGVSTHALVTHVSFNTAPVYVLAALLGWILFAAPDNAREAEVGDDGADERDRSRDRAERTGLGRFAPRRPAWAGATGVRGAPGAPVGNPERAPLHAPVRTASERAAASAAARSTHAANLKGSVRSAADSTFGQPTHRTLSRPRMSGEE